MSMRPVKSGRQSAIRMEAEPEEKAPEDDPGLDEAPSDDDRKKGSVGCAGEDVPLDEQM